MVLPPPLLDFLNGRFLITFSAFFLIRLASLAWKTPQNFARAPRALFSTRIWSKNTFLGLLVRRYENQKTFPLVFSSSCVLSPRAARRNFRFCPGIFLLKRSPDEVRGDWKSKILEIKSLSGHLRRGFAVTTRKKNTGYNEVVEGIRALCTKKITEFG